MGNLKLAELLTLPDYDFNRVGLLIRELEDTITVEEAKISAQNGEIISRVIKDDRPFHPQRLWETYHYFMGMGIYRSKGFSGYREDLTWLCSGTGPQEVSIWSLSATGIPVYWQTLIIT